MNNNFRNDYDALSLDDGADWATARATYRRQVNLWHPDRFTHRPRERAHAERRFIQLTRSFDNLRTFYRQNRRLPFEPVNGRAGKASIDPQAEPTLDQDTISNTRTSRPVNASANGGDEAPPDDAFEQDLLEAGILNSRTAAPRKVGIDPRKLLWPAVAASVVALTLGTFLYLDRSARQATLREGREVLRRTAPSEYMPSASEVQKRSSRGTFVEGKGNPRIGDQLMEDVFR